MQISKSDYMLYLRHPAWLWLKKHDKEKLPPIDEDTQAIFDAGFLFESYAEQLFFDAVKLGFDGYREYLSLTRRTKEAIDSGAKTIMQARFEAGEITCICDAIVRVDDNTFDLYEIKSSTSAKPEHEPDLAFQKEVLTQSGYKVNKIFVVHVNYEYVRDGEVKACDLCNTCEVTEQVEKLEGSTRENIKKALDIAKQKDCPDLSPCHAKLGAYGDWLSIYKTLADIDEYSIYHLCSPGAQKIGDLEDLGIKRLDEIPADFPLNEKQMRQVQATRTGDVITDKAKIGEFLASLKFPLYFLDYETLSSVVPYFDGLGPYKQLPFQYSLHVLESPDDEVKHFEYLHSDKSNPVRPLTEALRSQVGEEGTVLVWFEGFEKTCNELMGKILPEYESFYQSVNDRVVDLMKPFADGHYVHKDFFGSASIKKVLPVLIPELSYKELDINQGGAAQRLWMESVLDGKRDHEKDKILNDLLKYCELDTLAMVRIYQFLNKL
ncbi:MAG: hypothetical protein UT05_C0015G0004 [Parcubacteria group bacterium GW2011_GWF2_38_76]|nr:MAG: hypothetical protein UT05_C0015G0004 [Parcubacteria group bacterium GW2011_GWF2_38_76]